MRAEEELEKVCAYGNKEEVRDRKKVEREKQRRERQRERERLERSMIFMEMPNC